MKNTIILLFMLALTYSYSQSKLSSGVSLGIVSVEKENGIDANIYFGYNTSKNITIGLDGMISKVDLAINSLKTSSLIAYIEAGNPENGIIINKLFFSGIVGIGYLQQEIVQEKQDSGAAFFGTKVNYIAAQKLLVGLKSGYYINSHENLFIANVFLTFKFK